MKIVVFGADCKTGETLVRQALSQGHEVKAFFNQPNAIDFFHEKLQIIKADILNYCKVEYAIEGQEVVIIALDSGKEKESNYLFSATKNIIRAMENKKVNRMICISAAGVLGNDGGFIFDKLIQPLFYRRDFKEKKKQLRLIMRSNLDWIVVRPPQLIDSETLSSYHISSEKPKRNKVSRANLADFMLKHLKSTEYVHRMPIISN